MTEDLSDLHCVKCGSHTCSTWPNCTPTAKVRLQRLTTREALDRFLTDEFCQDGSNQVTLTDALDEIVHENKSREASDINNGGIPAQLDYLAGNDEDVRGLVEWLGQYLFDEENDG